LNGIKYIFGGERQQSTHLTAFSWLHLTLICSYHFSGKYMPVVIPEVYLLILLLLFIAPYFSELVVHLTPAINTSIYLA